MTDNDVVFHQLLDNSVTLGLGVSPENCQLIVRSQPHYHLRHRAQDMSARQTANCLKNHPSVAQVLHPTLSGSPGHEIWQLEFTGAASLFSIVFKTHISQDRIDRCAESLKLFQLEFSWGGAVSLIVPFARNQMPPSYSYEGILARFYIGLEDTNDLLQDVEQAFNQLLD